MKKRYCLIIIMALAAAPLLQDFMHKNDAMASTLGFGPSVTTSLHCLPAYSPIDQPYLLAGLPSAR